MSHNDIGEHLRQVVPVQASECRRIVLQYEESLMRGDVSVVRRWQDSWLRAPEQMAAAHSRRMVEVEDVMVRAMHSIMVLTMDAHKADIVPAELVAKAVTLLQEACLGSDYDKWHCAAQLARARLSPEAMKRQLVAMFSAEGVLGIIAACALSSYLPGDGAGRAGIRYGGQCVEFQALIDRMRWGLGAAHTMTAAIAARCIVRVSGDDGDKKSAQEAMVERLRVVMDVAELYAVIEAVEEIGRPASEALRECLFEVASNDARDGMLRYVATRAFTRLADSGDIEVFIALLGVESDDVRRGIIATIGERSSLEESVVRAAEAYLSHENPDVRVHAARVLACWPVAAEKVLPALLSRVDKEMDFYALDALADAIAVTGAQAAERMLEMLPTRNAVVLTAMGSVLRRLGSIGARALMVALEKHKDLLHRALLFVLIRDLGPAAREVMPDLGRLLVQTEDEDFALVIVNSISGAAGMALGALPYLIETVMKRDGAVAELAERAIRDIGPEAIPKVQEAMLKATGRHRDALERAMMWVPLDSKKFSRLQGLPADKLILFYHASGVWVKSGAATLEDVASILQAGGNLPRGVRASESTLQRAIKDLKKVFGNKDLVRGKARRPSEITEHGKTVRTHIWRFARQRGIRLVEEDEK